MIDINKKYRYRNGQWAEIVKEYSVEVWFSIFPDGSIDVSTIDEGEYSVAKKTITFYKGEGL